MTIDEVVQICSRALYVICITAAPVLVVSLIVGLIVSIFQTVTSIQEQTLTFVPKIVAVFLSLILLGNWMVTCIVDFMVELWSNFSLYLNG